MTDYPYPTSAQVAEAEADRDALVAAIIARHQLPRSADRTLSLYRDHWGHLTMEEQEALIDAHARARFLRKYGPDRRRRWMMGRQHRLSAIERVAWEPVLQQTLERCRDYARTATPRYGEAFPMEDAVLAEAADRFARITGQDRDWDGTASELHDHHRWLIMKRTIRPRVRDAWKRQYPNEGAAAVRERHRVAYRKGREQRAAIFAELARAIQKTRLKTGRQDIRTLYDAADALGRDVHEMTVEVVLRGHAAAEEPAARSTER